MPVNRRDFVKVASIATLAAGCRTTGTPSASTRSSSQIVRPAAPILPERRDITAEQAYPDLKIYDDHGYPWRQPIEDWEGAAKRVANDVEWKEWLAQEQEEVTTWITKFPLDRVEWSAGYTHYFVSPKDGSQITWTPAIPREEVDHFSSPSDPRIELTDVLVEAWYTEFRVRHAGIMSRAAALYRLTGNTQYSQWVANQFDYYARHYYDWRSMPRNLGAHLRWEPLAEAELISPFVAAIRWLGPVVTPQQRAWWKKGLFDAMMSTINQHALNIRNIGLWCRAVAGIVALTFDDEELWDWALNSEFGFRAQIHQGVTSDYTYKEDSYNYHNYAAIAGLRLVQEAALHGRIGDIAAEAAILENMFLVYLYARYPNGRVHYQGITAPWAMTPVPTISLFVLSYRCLPTTLGSHEAAKLHTIETLLDPPINPPAVVELPKITTRNFDASRFAVLKSDDWQVFFHYGQITGSRGQPECLNYSLAYGKEDLSHDTGAGAHDSPFRSWYNRPLCHNVPIIHDGSTGLTGPGKIVEFTPDVPRVVASQPFKKEGVVERSIEIVRDSVVDITMVSLDTLDAVPIGLALHVCGKITLPKIFTPTTSQPATPPRGFDQFKDVAMASVNDQLEVNVVYPSVTIRLTIETPGAFRVWYGVTPDQPVISSGQRESLYLETTGNKIAFTTTWTVALV